MADFESVNIIVDDLHISKKGGKAGLSGSYSLMDSRGAVLGTKNINGYGGVKVALSGDILSGMDSLLSRVQAELICLMKHGIVEE